MNGSMVKNHISSKKEFGYPAIRRTSFLLWFQACQIRPLDLHQLQRHLRDRRVIPHHLLQPRLLHIQLAKFRFEKGKMHLTVTFLQCQCLIWLMIDQGNLIESKTITSRPQKKETTIERGNPLYSEIPEWLQEFRENLVDDEIPVKQESHSSSSSSSSPSSPTVSEIQTRE